ncbi:MAG: OprD family outer membrane porin [Sulfuricurvum sp.]|nr:OprD family outer membrane porin [Sulfuricurvum sp.]
MRHTVRLSLLASILVMSASAADDLAGAFKEGKVSGQFREFSINRTIDDTRPVVNNDYTRKANTIGGYVKYETGSFNGLSMGAAAYGTIGVGLGDNRSTANREMDPTLLSNNNSNDLYLGEAYLQYKKGNTAFKGGRQKLDTPMAGSDDARMLPSLFEAYVVSNTDVKDTTLLAAQVTKFSQGTFGRAYTGGVLGVTSGYSLNNIRDVDTGQFVNMGTYAIGDSTSGVTTAAAIYSGIPGLKLQVWDYYARDILNAVYGEANYGWSAGSVAPYVAAQYINERDVGSNNVITKVKSDFMAAKVGAKVANFDIYGAISHNSKDASAAANGGTISPWGGMPAYTQGMVTRHQFMAGTNAMKVAGNYNWKDFGINLNTGVYYATFKMDALNGYSANYAWTAKESGFDMIFSPEKIKNLQLRLRANYADNFFQASTGGMSWDEYRFIVNYNF